ncbi:MULTISPECIES: 3-hydroxyacyl-ACP dehydratase FabZ family protein [unclassified Paludibacterium]|uniref:3-hydroxyacyl-ACP dehydratase FabZ family protein n=1 Tax=unclassified Paludibacterium TaxID=2618429 RepID=UPI001C04D745|nr:3-hydroxyacyl-ACP dehydratase [Paludibacterium sp. B53371]BEV73816.1 3-hydroxyacyl-ACP dehydratase FabZ [Paludibacterium sp. THUN1379]
MSQAQPDYPLQLSRAEIEQVLPHRGDIFFCHQLTINGPHAFEGTARWSLDHPLIRGHFPGMPIVPGVLLIEAMAQLTGAGLLVGDPYIKTLPEDSIGVLAGVRSCWFKQPVRPDSEVRFDIQCRQLAPALVQATARVQVDATEVAKLDLSIAYVPRQQVLAG